MKKQFSISADYMNEFAKALAERDLANEILGLNDDGDINVTVKYDKDQRYEVFELSELVENDFEVE